MNAHLEPVYRHEPWKCAHGRNCDCAYLPESEMAQNHCVILPLYHQMRDEEQTRVADALRQIEARPGEA